MNAKETITMAELRQTELYRREQTRPLREFLMENIDVLKLADEVEMWGEDLLALNMRGGIPVVQGAKMLRQQADLIRNLQKSLGFKNSGYETINLTPPVAWIDAKTGKPKMKGWVITDHDIPLYTHSQERPHNTVLVPCDKLAEMQAELAILRKAQVK